VQTIYIIFPGGDVYSGEKTISIWQIRAGDTKSPFPQLVCQMRSKIAAPKSALVAARIDLTQMRNKF